MLDFIKKIKNIGQISPPSELSMQRKKRLFSRINHSCVPVSEQLKALEHPFPPIMFTINAKERLIKRINALETRFTKKVYLYFMRRKPVFAAVTAFVLFITGTFFFVYDIPNIEAHAKTYLHISEGEVYVKHLGDDWTLAKDYDTLKVGDKVRTDKNARASVYFSGNIVTRLDNNTEIAITNVVSHPVLPKALVVLSLDKGKIWSKVLQLFDDYHKLQVETKNSIISANNASFSVEHISGAGTEVSIVDRIVDIKIINPEKKTILAETEISEGYETKIKKIGADEKKIRVTDVVAVEPISPQKIDTLWIQENIKKDKQYKQKIVSASEKQIKKNAGILPGSHLYGAKKMVEQAELALMFDESKREKKKFELADRRLNEAAGLISNGDNELAEKSIEEYKNTITKLAKNISKNNLIKDKFLDKVKEKDNYLVAIGPDSDFYKLKEAVKKAEELLAANTKEKEQIKLKNVSEKLFELQDLLSGNNFDLAVSHLKKYREESGLLNPFTEKVDKDGQKTLVKGVLEQKSMELRVFQILENQIKERKIKQLVKEAKEDAKINLDKVIAEMVSSGTIISDVMMLDGLNQARKKEIERKKIIVKENYNRRVKEFNTKRLKEKAGNVCRKIKIYKTWQGMKGQTDYLLSQIEDETRSLELLQYIKECIPHRVKFKVDYKMRDIKNINI